MKIINIMLVIVITFITMIVLYSNRANTAMISNNIISESEGISKSSGITVQCGAGFMFENYYNVNIKVSSKIK